MAEHRFSQVDVFSVEPYRGNPVAVVHDAGDVSDEEMQRFARWTNLSETTFLLPPTQPGADYRLRIFTTDQELPFAGHPTLGSAHAWLEAGGQPADHGQVVQEGAAGLVPVRRGAGGQLAFAAPPLVRSGPVGPDILARAVAFLGVAPSRVVDAAWVDNGPGWVGVLVDSAATVVALRPGHSDLAVGVIGPCPPGSSEQFEVRAWFPSGGTSLEDPVTGSLNASLAQWLLRTGRAAAPYVARQGTAMGRAGRVSVTAQADGTVWVGGGTVTCVRGTVVL
ncbi:MAG: PhzF family phenazine biosynthesis protein [Acidimicrobiales bacterium]